MKWQIACIMLLSMRMEIMRSILSTCHSDWQPEMAKYMGNSQQRKRNGIPNKTKHSKKIQFKAYHIIFISIHFLFHFNCMIYICWLVVILVFVRRWAGVCFLSTSMHWANVIVWHGSVHRYYQGNTNYF